ncbi:PREDICTED: sodium/hydrogen exchanger 4 isoform X2 [Ipomoea nil]|uniref:sodium/hydrogen exchanger 4 isoform X2 n=1 Tax=Ipomoea nil TaxID=35883 RepID=UPI000900A5A0|nr:PREDICTED: sodium/hydrogen exchanger 4 isoform X2 [Ipomoea nil]
MRILEYSRNLGSSSHEPVVPITVFVAILCLCLVIGHLLEDNRWLNESIAAIFIGFIAGTVILLISKGKNSHILRFNEELFFIYLLPPIIFNAGFQVKKKHFFQNFLTIMLFGVAGVFISTSIITAGSWLLFSMLNIVDLTVRDYLDTVCTLQVLHQEETPLLYSLVFGEGVVNDATSVVLFNAIQKIDVNKLDGWALASVLLDFLYLFSTSTALGVGVGLLTSFILRVLYFGRHSTVREIALMVLMAYLSYMLAELFNLSGILTVFLCGVLMSHYAWHNVTEGSRITTRHMFATLSFIAETFIFVYVGMDALDIEKWRTSNLSVWKSATASAIVLLVTLVGRAAFVFPLSALSNCMNRNRTRSSSITLKHQVIICWAGLMRGAVSIALAFNQFTFYGITVDPTHATMVTITIIVVLFSTIVFGFLTKPLVCYLLPCHHGSNIDQEPSISNNSNLDREPSISKDDDVRLPLLSFEESAATNILRAKDSLSMLIERPVYIVHSYWRRFDDAYMRPIFGGSHCQRHESPR